jgi:hypothetical protein
VSLALCFSQRLTVKAKKRSVHPKGYFDLPLDCRTQCISARALDFRSWQEWLDTLEGIDVDAELDEQVSFFLFFHRVDHMLLSDSAVGNDNTTTIPLKAIIGTLNRECARAQGNSQERQAHKKEGLSSTL